MSLTRAVFIVAAVAFLMPTPPDAELDDLKTDVRGELSHVRLIYAASDTVSDVSHFCTRQPAVCEAAHHLYRRLEAKAKYSVRLLYEWASDQTADGPLPYPYRDQAKAPIEDPAAPKVVRLDQAPGQGTLTIEDLIPEWRGPKAVKRI